MHAFAACLDNAKEGSCCVVTTRIQSLISSATEVPLALLSADDAAKMLLTTAGVRAVPPYSEEVLAAAQACGRLPLTLAIAGGILDEIFFGEVTAEFVALLQEDHSQVLREGQFGDEHVQLEDSLIALSLKGYVGAEREQVVSLFRLFGIFPEDVAVPLELFDRLATTTPALFGMEEGSKRPHLKVGHLPAQSLLVNLLLMLGSPCFLRHHRSRIA